ncbi:O-acetyl-ADP-ribose deacetylase [Phytophthora citrophthora]|uniref:O-acetyl-ADP-ribose deacetylase n=1 Tax=Phytophthora citrophthora TaxID=4793 RepID=A0AAD9FZK0_9STRA|nr:O-acetyl-ADP-ribose deacetylase [Phytophthora citrophthora]
MPRTKRRGTSSRRRSAKTGRFISATAPGLAGTLLFRKELLHDFVLFVDAQSLLSLCEAMTQVSCTRVILLDEAWWQELLMAHFGVPLKGSKVHRSVTLAAGCLKLLDYLSLRSQRERFERYVHVVKGDLGTITTVGDQPVDCLVFPTSCSYRNPGTGVAGRVHERAGPSLDQAVVKLHMKSTAKPGSAMCTVGCGSGVRVLVHCVGPTPRTSNADKTLYTTYVNAFLVVDNNDALCAAVASISTGLFRFPVPRATDIALSAIRDLIRLRPSWKSGITFVCIDDDVYENFQRARQETFQAFHTKGIAHKGLVKKLSMEEFIVNEA